MLNKSTIKEYDIEACMKTDKKYERSKSLKR